MAESWTLEVHTESSDQNCQIKIAYPRKLSVTGLKNLIQEKTNIPSSKLQMKYTDEATASELEINESSEKLGALFLRDYPKIKNGSKLSVTVGKEDSQ